MGRRTRILVFLAVFILLHSGPVFAAGSVFICNGVYQNRPCAKGVTGTQKALPSLSKYKARNYIVPEEIQERDIPLSSLDPVKLNEQPEAASSTENIPPELNQESRQETKNAMPELESAAGKVEEGDFRISDPRINEELTRVLGH